ncbi:MAG TPA: alpha/beta hydrolase-fold protein [Ignavibacteriaceae bacterium]|nr:alpha/beta hydrolase-fold protein [Ignavibacteriaceae bacterium]
MKMKIFITIILLTVSYHLCYAQQEKIKFIVITSDIGKQGDVYITGNTAKLGNWDASSVPLNKINDSTWSKVFEFNDSTTIQYKFTRGTWQSEALTSDGKIPSNYKLKVTKDTVVIVNISKWGKGLFNKKPMGKITGTVEYFRKLTGKGIKPRDIIVWLPPSYKKDKAKRYPVLYMEDGQNIFDPKTSSFGVDWQLDEAADSLIKAKAIKEIIIVGIYNTSDRGKEYLDTKIGHDYMNFIVDKLKPFIDKRFRTLPDRLNTATGGSSAGGLISFMLLWEYPNVFSQAACLSPAFDIDNINFVKNVKEYDGKKKPIRMYIDIGTKDLEVRLRPGVDEMVNVLESKGYKAGKDLKYFIANGATHNEEAWSKRNWRYLEFMFGK